MGLEHQSIHWTGNGPPVLARGFSERALRALKAPQWAVDLLTSNRVTESNVGHISPTRRARFKAPEVGVSAVGGRDMLCPALGAVRAPSTQSVELTDPSRFEGHLVASQPSCQAQEIQRRPTKERLDIEHAQLEISQLHIIHIIKTRRR